MNCKEHHLPELELATGQVREALQAILHTILFIRSPGPVAPCDVHCEGFNLTYTRIANDAAIPSNTGGGGNRNSPPSSAFDANHSTNTNKISSKQQQQHYLDQKVDDSIEAFLRTLTQIGPELLSGCLTLSFFERRASRQLFGLVSHEEKVIWEQWILHVVVNNTPRPVNDDSASVMERQRIQDTAEAMLRSVLMKIFDSASGGGGTNTTTGGGDRNGNNEPMSNNNMNTNTGGGGGIMTSNLDYIPPVMYEFEIRCSKRADDRENLVSRVKNMPAMLNLDGS